MRGLQMAGSSISSGFGGLGDVLAQRMALMQGQADRQALAGAYQYTDADAYRQALASGSVIGDPNRLSLGVLEALGGRAGVLDRENTGRIAAAANQYALDRTRDLDARGDAAAPFAASMLGAAGSGNVAEQLMAASNGREAVSRLPIDQQIALARGVQDAGRSRLTMQGQDIGNQAAQFGLNRDQISFADQQAAQRALQYVQENSADPTSARQAYTQATRGLSAAAANAVRSSMDPTLFGYVGAGAGGPVAQATSGGPGASGYSFVDRDALHIAQRQAESGNRPNAVSNKGAQGLMQLMPATAREWEDKLGVPAGSTKTNPEINERVGRAYMDSLVQRYDGNQVQALAAYNWGMGNVDKWIANGQDFSKLPKETRDYIGKILPTQAGVSNPLATAGQQDEIARRFNQNNSNSSTARVMSLIDSQEAIGDVAKGLTDGALKGMRQGEVVGELNRIMRDGNVNAAQAGAILADSLQDRGIASRVGNGVLNYLTRGVLGDRAGVSFNEGRINSEVQRLNSTAALQAVSSNRDLQTASTRLAASQANIDQLRQNVQALTVRARDMPNEGNRGALARAEANLARAYIGHQQLMGVTEGAAYQADLASRQAAPARQVGGAPAAQQVPAAATHLETSKWLQNMQKMQRGEASPPNTNNGQPSWLIVR